MFSNVCDQQNSVLRVIGDRYAPSLVLPYPSNGIAENTPDVRFTDRIGDSDPDANDRKPSDAWRSLAQRVTKIDRQ